MFENIRENLRKAAEERSKKQEEDAREEAKRRSTADAEARQKAERERKIAGIRVITGDVKYRYAILDTLRVYAHYVSEPGQPYDPTASTQQATRMMQELAYTTGADAVIHAQYQVIRYATTRRGYQDVPAYETHLFGTAIKIMGPPVDWENPTE